MVSASQISNLAPYYGTETTLVEDHTIPDIMNGIEYMHDKKKQTYDKFSQYFWKGSPEATAKYIFDFLRQNVRYVIEQPDDQTVKSPGAIVGDRFGDCKHYALFSNGVLASLQRKGYNVGKIAYRFCGYYPGSSDLHHVFSVIKSGSKEIWIDPVLKNFNDRGTPYSVHQDSNIMPLKEINGVYYPGSTPPISGLWDDIKKGAQNTVNKVKAPVMSIAVAPSRNAFLLLLKVNAFNLAHRLYDFMHRSKEQDVELSNKWKSLGGDPDILKKNINEGMAAYLSRQKMTAAAYNQQKGFVNGIGSNQAYTMCCYYFPYYMPMMSDGKRSGVGEPVTTATAATLMTAAAAIIAALAPMLKKAGWSPDDQKNTQNMVNAGAAALSYAAGTSGNGTTFGTGTAVLPDGSTQSMLEATVNTTADGTKVVTVKDTGSLNAQTGGGSITETLKQAWDSTKAFVIEYKMPITLVAIAYGAYKFEVFKGKKGKK